MIPLPKYVSVNVLNPYHVIVKLSVILGLLLKRW
jgi:hypothetical protein